MLQINIPKDFEKPLTEVAEEYHLSLNEVVAQAIEMFLEDYQISNQLCSKMNS